MQTINKWAAIAMLIALITSFIPALVLATETGDSFTYQEYREVVDLFFSVE